jgi:uncharacterized membrane protein
VSSEAIAEEVVRTPGSAIGLVLAVPITTAIATAVVSSTAPTGRRRRNGVEVTPRTNRFFA